MAGIVVSSLNLKPRGKRLFESMNAKFTSDPIQMELLVEACRIVDQLEDMHDMVRGDPSSWKFVKMPRGGGNLYLEIDNLISTKRQLQLALKTITAQLSVAGEGSGEGEVTDVADDVAKRRAERLAENARRRAAGNASS